ncbi:MAG: hypothetical protein LPK21_01700, partial [Hymenobacteraceae bacterium]|nr:hypothetical protein [Hymenobacteraceae bacterium]
MKNLMINFRITVLFIAVSIAFSAILSGCSATASDEKVTASTEKVNVKSNSHLIVFIDKTMSNVTSEEVIKKQVLNLDGLIQEHLTGNGDSFYAYTVHSSTGPGSGFQQTVLNINENA